jgi:hypothetical protein
MPDEVPEPHDRSAETRSVWLPRQRTLDALIQADSGLRDELAEVLDSRVDEL